MTIQQTFITPSGLFFISMVSMYLLTALLHPKEFSVIIYGLLYVLCIPSGYLLLAIYSMVNMDNVAWGTRESNQTTASDETKKNLKWQKLIKLCSYSLEFWIRKDQEDTCTMPLITEPETENICKSEEG